MLLLNITSVLIIHLPFCLLHAKYTYPCTVDNSLIGKYRTYEVSDENLYNFIKNTLQQSYSCIFDFDTYNRVINVKDVSSTVPTNPLYISLDNLAKEITIEEDTESIITRLDVNGAEGVDIRDVNPTGNNKIINLDYYMTTDNFDQPQSTNTTTGRICIGAINYPIITCLLSILCRLCVRQLKPLL